MRTIITTRLELQPLEIKHADRLYELFQNWELHQFIWTEPPKDILQFRKKIEFQEKLLSPDGTQDWLNWIGVDPRTQEIVSKIEITVMRAVVGEQKIAYIAYYTFPPFQKQGFAHESCAAVMEYMFRERGIEKIIIEMDVLNTASVKLAESLGAKRVSFTPAAQVIRGRVSDEWVWEVKRSPSRVN